MPHAVSLARRASLVSGLFIAGGYRFCGRCVVNIDVCRSMKTRPSTWRLIPPPPDRRVYMGLGRIGTSSLTGKLSGDFGEPLLVYDPQSDTWTNPQVILLPLSWHACGVTTGVSSCKDGGH